MSNEVIDKTEDTKQVSAYNDLFLPFQNKVHDLIESIGIEISDQKVLIKRMVDNLAQSGGKPGPLIFISSLYSNVNSARSNQIALLKSAIDIIKIIEDLKIKTKTDGQNDTQIKAILQHWMLNAEQYTSNSTVNNYSRSESDEDIEEILAKKAKKAKTSSEDSIEDKAEKDVKSTNGNLVATRDKIVYLVNDENEVLKTYTNKNGRFKFFNKKGTQKLSRVHDTKKDEDITIVKRDSLIHKD
jgi:hypothetical protein